MRKRMGKTFELHEFGNVPEFVKAATKYNRFSQGGYKMDRGWYGGESEEESVRMAIEGSTKHVKAAREIMMACNVAVETPRQEWTPSPCGAYPVIPEVLIGYPDNMRAMIDNDSDRAPVRVFVDLVCSAGTGIDEIVNRGAALTALVEKLGRTRPVELIYVVPYGNGTRTQACIVTMRAGVTPITLSLMAHHQTSAGFFRGLGYGYCESSDNFAHPGTGTWAWGINSDNREYFTRLQAALELRPLDVLIVGKYLTDKRDGPKFVQDQIAEFNKRLAEFRG